MQKIFLRGIVPLFLAVAVNGRIFVFQRVIVMMKNPELAKQMRLLRKTNNYTQQQIADILQIDRTTYTAYELCKNTPDIMLLDAFAKIFSVSIAGREGQTQGAPHRGKL